MNFGGVQKIYFFGHHYKYRFLGQTQVVLYYYWVVVVAQLVERSLPTPEIHGSNPVISKLLYRTFNCLSAANCIEKTKIKKKKRPGMAHFYNKQINLQMQS